MGGEVGEERREREEGRAERVQEDKL